MIYYRIVSASQRGGVVMLVMMGIAAAALMSTLIYLGHFQMARGAAVQARIAQDRNTVTSALYALAAESADVDNDGYLEAPPVKFAPAGTSIPPGGGQIPDTSRSPKMDAWGSALGLCSWDNGPSTLNASPGRINGDSTTTLPAASLNSVVLTVISAGPNKVFETSCAMARHGQGGDDYVARLTHAQVTSVVGGTRHFGDPATAASLATLNPGVEHDGQVRVQTDTNTLVRWNASATAWVPVKSESTAASSSSMSTFVNHLINGNFEIWQRGEGPVNCGTIYCFAADRWMINGASTNGGRQSSGLTGGYSWTAAYIWDKTELGPGSGPELPATALNVYRTSRSGDPSANMEVITQRVEDAMTLAGQTVTASFWIRTHGPDKDFCFDLFQYYGSGQSPAGVRNGLQCYRATSTWSKKVFTVTLGPVDPTKLLANHALYFRPVMEPPGSISPRSDTFGVSIAQAQLEIGSVSSKFDRRPYAFELALAQRYYETGVVTAWPAATSYNNWYYTAWYNSVYVYFSATKRAATSVSFTPLSAPNPYCADSSTRVGDDYSFYTGPDDKYFMAWRAGISTTQGWRCTFQDRWIVDAEIRN